MSDALDLDAIERYWVLEERGRPGLAQRDVAALVAEVRRLRALLTAPPTDAEWSQFIWDERRNGLRWAMDHFVERRARKIGGDTDE